MENPLKKEFDYYVEHQNDLVKDYEGKFVVIKDQQIIGAYDSQQEAYAEARKSNELGTFLIQQVTPGEGSYTQTFHSRVG